MRTSKACLILHPDYEQIHVTLDFGTKKLSNLVEYPDICYRCEPDRYLEQLAYSQEQVKRQQND